MPVVSRDESASFQTDSLQYTLAAGSLGYSATISVTFTNNTGRTAYIANCNGGTLLTLERFVDGQWKMAWAPIVPACLSAPIVIPAGATHLTHILVFGGFRDSNVYPQFDVADPTGVYRAVWYYVLSSYQDRAPFGEPLALELRTSNRFVLVTGPRR